MNGRLTQRADRTCDGVRLRCGCARVGGRRPADGPGSGADPEAALRRVAVLLGRLHRPPLQRAEADQPVEREEPLARVDGASQRRPERCRQPRHTAVRAAPPRTILGGVGNNDFVGGTDGQGFDPCRGRCAVCDGARQRVGARCHDGHLLWQFFWRTKGGTHIGNRGAAMWRNYLFFVTPDCYLVSLDARTGEERWHKEIANFNQQYF